MRPESYAQAILELLGKGERPKSIVSNLYNVLEAQGRKAFLTHIARAFTRAAARDMQKNRSVLVVARKKDEKQARKSSGAKNAQLLIDENIVGGWRFENKEELIDASHKKHLLSIYNQVAQ